MDKLAKKVFGVSALLGICVLALLFWVNPAKADVTHDGFWVQTPLYAVEPQAESWIYLIAIAAAALVSVLVAVFYKNKPKKLTVLFGLFFAAFGVPKTAKADYYATIGIGSSEHHYRHDGFWVQKKVPHDEDDTQNMWSLGIGKEIKPWLSAELTYYDLGQWSNFIKFCSDSDYDKDACRTNTDAGWVSYGYGRGESHALAATLLPTYRNGRFAAFVRAGFTYYWTKYEAKAVTDGDDIHKDFDTWANPTMVRGMGYVAGGGLEYRGARVEYLVFPDISGSDTAHDRVTALTVSWKIDL